MDLFMTSNINIHAYIIIPSVVNYTECPNYGQEPNQHAKLLLISVVYGCSLVPMHRIPAIQLYVYPYSHSLTSCTMKDESSQTTY